MDWDTISKELKKPLDPSAIKPPPKGKFGEYVEGLHVIQEANRIFGFDGWSYEVTRLQLVSEQTVDLKGQNGPYQQYRVGYLCSVRVTVDGVTREGVAVGNGSGKPENMADQHESAAKEAETDALKRALRTFGNTFGLALYEKDRNKREVGKPEPTRPELRDMLKAWMNAPKTTPEDVRKAWLSNDNFKAKLASLPQPMQLELKAEAERICPDLKEAA
jgi:DNA recombination protein Rad52